MLSKQLQAKVRGAYGLVSSKHLTFVEPLTSLAGECDELCVR